MKTDIRRLNKNSFFVYAPGLEPVFAAFALILGTEEAGRVLSGVYDEKTIRQCRDRFRYLAETCAGIRAVCQVPMLDALLDLAPEELGTKSLQKRWMSMPLEERIFRQGTWRYFGVSKAQIKKALREDAALAALHAHVAQSGVPFLALSAFLRENDRIVKDFFSLADALDLPCLKETVRKNKAEIDALYAQIAEELQAADALTVSENRMGKTIRNRGPYEQFFFLPVRMLPRKAMRLFFDNGTKHNRQMLFLSLAQKETDISADIVPALKALGDASRYRLMRMLSAEGPMRGTEIAKRLSLSPPTVTHHLEQLKDAGLVTEEPSGNAKFFGISKAGVKELSELLQRELLP